MANQALSLEQFMGVVGQPTAPAAATSQPFTVEELQQIIGAVPQPTMPPSPYRTQGLGGPGINPEQIMGTAGRFLQGVGRGASFGVTDPLAALAIMGTRALTGGAPMNFGQALQQVKEGNIAARDAGSAYDIGNITGGLTTGGLLGIGRTLPGTVARGATMGGVSGALSERPDQIFSPEGATIGALAGGLGGALTYGLSMPGRAVIRDGQVLPSPAEKLVRDQYVANQMEAVNKYTARALSKDSELIQRARNKLLDNAKNEMRIGPNRPAAQALNDLQAKIDEIAMMTDDEILKRIGTPNNPGIPGLKINPKVFDDIRIRNQRVDRIAEAPTKSVADLYKSLKSEAGREVGRAREITMAAIPGMSIGALTGAGMALVQGQPQSIPAYAALMAGAGGGYTARGAMGQAARELGVAGLARFPGVVNIPPTTSAALTGGLASIANLPQYDYRMLLGQ